MVSKPKVKKFVDNYIATKLEEFRKSVKLADLIDLSSTAKQKDVEKVKEELLNRANKLRGQGVNEADQVPVSGV